jgi:DNA-binding GntR family transcriptional regulator
MGMRLFEETKVVFELQISKYADIEPLLIEHNYFQKIKSFLQLNFIKILNSRTQYKFHLFLQRN